MTSNLHQHFPSRDDGQGDAAWRLHIHAGADVAAAGAADIAVGDLAAELKIAQRSEVTFIEGNVADLPTLLAGLAGKEVHVLDAGQDGLQQIAAILEGRTDIDALHIITHGETAAVNFGALTLDRAGVEAHQAELAAIGRSMAVGGDIMLYGCDVGAGSSGQAFVDRLAVVTGADVAASSDLTGAAAQGGDWDLEISSGNIETQAVVDPALAATYQQVLSIGDAPLDFETRGNFADYGGFYGANEDVIYRINNDSTYRLRVDGASHGVGLTNYGTLDIGIGGGAEGGPESAVTFSFVDGQLFSALSINLYSYFGQVLHFKAYDVAGHQVGTTQTFDTNEQQFTELSFAGLTRIATLKLTADASSQGGLMTGVRVQDLHLGSIVPPPPTVTSVDSTKADGAYKAGETIDITVKFSSAVAVTGTPQLTLATGGAGSVINYTGGTGTNTLTFRYTVQAGDNSADLDFSGTSALTLNGGTITQAVSGDNATLTLPTPGMAGSLGANADLVIDTTAPTVTIGSSAATLHGSQTATITFTFSEDPGNTFAWNGTSGDVVVTGGTLSAITGTGLTRTATFTPTAGTQNGTASITVTANSYQDAAGNNGGAGLTPSITYDTLAPTVSAPVLSVASDSGAAGDGITNVVRPTFTGTAEANATVTLYDSDGTTVLGTDVADGNGDWAITTITAMSQGAHNLTVKATDTAGNVSGASSVLSVTIDTTAPAAPTGLALDAASDTGDSSTDRVTNDTTPTFTGTAEANATVRLYDSDGTTVLGSAVADGSGRWEITSSALAHGVHNVTANATDAAGNVGGASTALAVTIDTTAPTLVITSSVSSVGGNDTATITFTFSENPGNTFTWNGTSGDVVVTGGTLSAITGSGLTRTATFTPEAGAASGTASITVAAGTWQDLAGNAGGAGTTPTLTYDTLAPGAPSKPVLSTASDSGARGDNLTNETMPTFTGTAEANATVRLYDTDGSTLLGTGVADGSGNWEITVDAPLGDATHSVTVKATDASGNVSGASAALAVTIDTTAPTVVITSSVASVGGSGTATITFTFSEDPGTSFSWDGTSGDVVVTGGTLGAIAGTGLTRTATFTPVGGNAGVDASITIAAGTWQDAAGNNGGAGTTPTLHVDTLASPPVIAGLDPDSDSGISDADGITSEDAPTVTGTAEANATVTLYDTDGTELGTDVADGSGKWSITPGAALAPGSHTLTAIQTDASGNESLLSDGYTLTIDTAAPGSIALSATTVAQSNATTGATVATVTALDATAVTYAFAGSDGTLDADNGKFTFDGNGLVAAQNLLSGTYHIYVIATDAAGNSSYEALAIEVVDAPAVTSIVRAGGAADAVAASTRSVVYTVTFNQAVTGVDASDFVLSSNDDASGTIADVTGSGSTYTVTVTGIGGDGTLRLDLNASGTGIVSGSAVPIAGGYTAGQTYLLDHTPPAAPPAPVLGAASDTGTADNDRITGDTTPTVKGTAEANATVTLYDTNGTTVLGTDVADGSGHWEITSTVALAEGAHSLTVKATDAAGNQGAASTALAVTIDTTAPTLAISSDVDKLGSGETATITFTFSEDPGNTFTWDGFRGDVQVTGGTLSAIAGTGLTRTATFTPFPDIASGSASIGVAAGAYTDAAGNPGGAGTPPALTYDTLAPAAPSAPVLSTASDTGTADDDGITGDTTPTFTGTAEPLATVTLYDTDGIKVLGTATADGSGKWSITSTQLADGVHDITVTATDAAGNTGTPSAPVTVTIDATPPAAPPAPVLSATSDTGPSDHDGITRDTTPTVTGTADPDTLVTLYDTDGTTVLGTATAGPLGDWSITSTLLAPGSHTLTITHTDVAGNESPAGAALAVTIDTAVGTPAAPRLAAGSDTGRSSSDQVTADATPTITGTGEAHAAITLYDTNGTTVLGTATADGSGNWSIASAALLDGEHTLTVTQTDQAGNLSAPSTGLVVTIDTTRPIALGEPLLAPASDSGTAGDGITNVARPVVSGTAEAFAIVTLYDTDGTTVLGTTTADALGGWHITSRALTLGAHTLTVRQTDVAGNESLAGAPLALTIQAPPVPPSTPTDTIDGVPVTQQPVALPGGGSGTQVNIPIVVPDRNETTGEAGVADIPLASDGTGTLLLAQLAPGFGLTATGGASQPAGASQESLIQAILAATPDHPVGDQGHLTGNGVTFLNQLASSVPLLVETIVPVSGPTPPTGALTLTGTSTPVQHTALVIDVTGLPADSKLVLNAVDFAAIIGSADVTGNTHGQILTGDAASQRFTVTAGSDSAVFSGGGNDTLVFAPSATAPAGTSAAALPAGTTVLHGGLDDDTVVFGGKRADYTIDYHDGHLIVTANGQPDQHALVVNAETLQFADGAVAVENRAVLDTIAGLYHDILGRQADYTGIDFWGRSEQAGVSLGEVALQLIASPELQGEQPTVFNGDSAHDVALLYQAIFSRAADTAGLAYWVEQMGNGLALVDVAQQFVTSTEMTAHKIGAQDWDFGV